VIQSAFPSVVLEESEYGQEEREKEELLELADGELEAHPWKDASRMVKCETSGAPVPVPLSPVSLDLAPFMIPRVQKVLLVFLTQLVSLYICILALISRNGVKCFEADTNVYYIDTVARRLCIKYCCQRY
jgi:hypothetical protein